MYWDRPYGATRMLLWFQVFPSWRMAARYHISIRFKDSTRE